MVELGDDKKADYCRMLVDICAMLSKDSRNYLLMQELRGGALGNEDEIILIDKKAFTCDVDDYSGDSNICGSGGLYFWNQGGY